MRMVAMDEKGFGVICVVERVAHLSYPTDDCSLRTALLLYISVLSSLFLNRMDHLIADLILSYGKR